MNKSEISPPICVLWDEMNEGVRSSFIHPDKRFKCNNRPLSKTSVERFANADIFTPLHDHEGIEILFIEQGSATILVDAKPIEVGTGDIIFINPFEPHGIYLTNRQTPFRRICLQFHPHSIFPCVHQEESLYTKLRALCFQNIIFSTHPTAAAIGEHVLQIANSARRAGMEAALSMYANLLAIYDLCGKNKLLYEPPEGACTYQREFAVKIDTYIEEHLNDDISTAQVAAYCQYTTEHFCRLFKKCFDKTFKTYLNIFRIQRAKWLIDQGSESTVSEIASRCGFNSQNHFGTLFKKYIGTPPSEYMERRRKSEKNA